MTDRTIAVTGGFGFLGSALVRAMAARGDRVRVLDNGARGRASRVPKGAPGVTVVAGDVRNPTHVNRLVRGATTVVHLAAINGTRNFYEQPYTVLQVGAEGILNVIEACRRHGVDDLIAFSSSEVYHEPPRFPTDESVPLVLPDPTNPRFSYAASKILTEVAALHSGLGRPVVVRPHNVYGPDMGNDHVIPELIQRLVRLANSRPTGTLRLPIQGDGSQRRAFLFVDDLVDATLLLMAKARPRTVYHVGNPEEVTIGKLVQMLSSLVGRTVRPRVGPVPKGGTRRRVPDIRRIRRLGFRPKTPLLEGLKVTLEWHRQQLADKPRQERRGAT